jgi:hypothetical protein
MQSLPQGTFYAVLNTRHQFTVQCALCIITTDALRKCWTPLSGLLKYRLVNDSQIVKGTVKRDFCRLFFYRFALSMKLIQNQSYYKNNRESKMSSLVNPFFRESKS